MSSYQRESLGMMAESTVITVTHAVTGHAVEVSVPDPFTVMDVRCAVLGRIPGSKLSQITIVGGRGYSLKDDEIMDSPQVLCIGKALEKPPPPKPPQMLNIKMFLSRELNFVIDLSIMEGSTVRALKENLASTDPTQNTKPESINIRLPRHSQAGSVVLSDETELTTQHLELDVY